jgi:hypothetical protein
MVYVPSSERTPNLVGVILLKTGATSEASALPLTSLSGRDRRQLARLLRKEVIHETRDGGRYWVDEDRLRECARKRRMFALVAIVIMTVVTLVIALYLK